MLVTVVHLELFLKISGDIVHLEKTDVTILLEQVDGLIAWVDGTVLKTV